MPGVGKRAPRMAGPDIDIRGLVTCFFIAEDESGICDLVLANKSGGCIVERRWASAMARRDRTDQRNQQRVTLASVTVID